MGTPGSAQPTSEGGRGMSQMEPDEGEDGRSDAGRDPETDLPGADDGDSADPTATPRPYPPQ